VVRGKHEVGAEVKENARGSFERKPRAIQSENEEKFKTSSSGEGGKSREQEGREEPPHKPGIRIIKKSWL